MHLVARGNLRRPILASMFLSSHLGIGWCTNDTSGGYQQDGHACHDGAPNNLRLLSLNLRLCAQAVEHCTEAARGHTDTSSLPCSQKSAQCQSLQSTKGAAQASVISMPGFEAAVLTRLAKRGYASIIAQEAWNAMSNDSAHPPSEVGNHGMHVKKLPFSEDATAASASEDARSDGQASHARASTLHDSHSAMSALHGRHQGKREIAASLCQAPSPDPATPSEPAQAEAPMAGTDSRNSAAVMTIQRLLCQITDSQALEKILAALLLEGPAYLSQKSGQVGPFACL